MSSRIYWLANASSPHVRHWAELVRCLDMDIEIISIWHKNSIDGFSFEGLRKKSVLPKCLSVLPESIQYFCLGLLIRFGDGLDAGVIHAHNASGYGFSALLSGRCYGVTTYGSEIFSASSKSFLYRVLIRFILEKAQVITASSKAMENCLVKSFGINKKKIQTFSLGVSKEFYFDEEAMGKVKAALKLESAPVWISNRRVHPLYNIIEVAKAFKKFRNEHGVGCLIILEGDSEPSYLEKVEALVDGVESIKLIRGFKSQSELRRLISASDFSISVPTTDQLSSSILESAMCGTLPLLRKLDSYEEVNDIAWLFDLDKGYEQLFSRSLSLYIEENSPSLRLDLLKKAKRYKAEFVLEHIKLCYKRM